MGSGERGRRGRAHRRRHRARAHHRAHHTNNRRQQHRIHRHHGNMTLHLGNLFSGRNQPSGPAIPSAGTTASFAIQSQTSVPDQRQRICACFLIICGVLFAIPTGVLVTSGISGGSIATGVLMGLFLFSGIILCKVWQHRTQGAVLQTVTATYDPEGQPQFTAGAQLGTTVYFNTPHGTILTYQSDGANLSGTAVSSNQDLNAGAPPSYWDITQQDLQNRVQQNAQSGPSVYNGTNPAHQYNSAQPSPGELSPGQPSPGQPTQYAAHAQDTSQTEQNYSQPHTDENPPQYVPPTGEGQLTEAPPIFEGPPPEAPPPASDGQEHLPAPPTYEEAQAL